MNEILMQDIQRVCRSNRDLEQFSDSTILITGATGFVGSFLVHTLMQYRMAHHTETKVIAMVRNEEKADRMFREYRVLGMLSYLVQDVREAVHLEEPVDYIIHCASNAGPREYGANPVGTMMTNFLGTDALLTYARDHSVKRFMYASTIEIYGATSDIPQIGEHDYGVMDATNVRSCYPLSKKACETLSISYYEQYGVPVVIGRLSYLYGAGMSKEDSKVVAQFPRKIMENSDIVMKSKGEQLRSYTYISDAVSAMITILARGENGEAYNIATPVSRMTIAQLAQTLVELYPEKGLKVVFDLPTELEAKQFSFINDAVMDSTKLEALGFTAQVEPKEGLRRVVESMLADE